MSSGGIDSDGISSGAWALPHGRLLNTQGYRREREILKCSNNGVYGMMNEHVRTVPRYKHTSSGFLPIFASKLTRRFGDLGILRPSYHSESSLLGALRGPIAWVPMSPLITGGHPVFLQRYPPVTRSLVRWARGISIGRAERCQRCSRPLRLQVMASGYIASSQCRVAVLQSCGGDLSLSPRSRCPLPCLDWPGLQLEVTNTRVPYSL